MPGGAAPIATGNPFRQKLMPRSFVVPFMLVTSLFFAWGFAYGLLDVLNKHFQNVLGITKLQSTGLQVAYFGIGYFAFSPVAGEVLRRRGYKTAIIMGLGLYSTGAILFWPVAKFSSTGSPTSIFAGFVVLTGLTACGLATLEVSANSYVTVMPPAGPASFRLQLSQSFNGIASFSGPLIASKYFFTGENANNLTNVQYVYAAVSGLGVALAIAFFFVRLPEVSEQDLQDEQDAISGNVADVQLSKPFIKQVRPILGAVCQFMYVGAQVTIGTFFINLATDDTDMSDASASNLLSYALITFTVMRFVSTALLMFFSSSFILVVAAGISALMVALMGSLHGAGGIVAMIICYGCMAPQYPIIFVLSTENLGRHTRRAAATLVMGVSGGAIFPPIQGAIADFKNTRVSMWLSFPAFIYVAGFAAWIWMRKGRHILLKTELAALAEQQQQQMQYPASESPIPEKEKDTYLESERVEYRS